jgi:hypothetical protein
VEFTIDVELPERLRGKWNPVAYRVPVKGERWVSKSNAICHGWAAVPKLIVEPIDQQAEIKKWWPRECKFDYVTRAPESIRGWFANAPPRYMMAVGLWVLEDGLQFDASRHITPPVMNYIADQCWSNPWGESEADNARD